MEKAEFKGYMTTNEYDLLARYAKKARYGIVDIGTYVGASAKVLRQNSLQDIPVWTIDCFAKDMPYERNPLNIFYDSFAMLDNVFIVIGDSKKIGKFWNNTFDLLVIDGDHTYEGIKSDVENWAMKIMSGGFVILHDATNISKSYMAENGQVCQANEGVAEYLKVMLKNWWQLIEVVDSIAVLRHV